MTNPLENHRQVTLKEFGPQLLDIGSEILSDIRIDPQNRLHLERAVFEKLINIYGQGRSLEKTRHKISKVVSVTLLDAKSSVDVTVISGEFDLLPQQFDIPLEHHPNECLLEEENKETHGDEERHVKNSNIFQERVGNHLVSIDVTITDIPECHDAVGNDGKRLAGKDNGHTFVVFFCPKAYKRGVIHIHH
ncbi:uncharacterized protein LOC131892215 [Tigriopus californicus]|uniref:uncharacterized protein LOC131892215 n=1 Tax=Tigriopus californicus TaxID=6832 RepID=UPI0027DA74BA|nr:uncharacterized protein LOC131892215 [Tigriopus californicus]XP_059097983.1 uncharacterized protein LOC131892215 [Tigriopus californicus]